MNRSVIIPAGLEVIINSINVLFCCIKREKVRLTKFGNCVPLRLKRRYVIKNMVTDVAKALLGSAGSFTAV